MIIQGASGEIATLIEQGMVAVKAGNKEAALAVFRFATQVEPNNETAWLWLASLYTELPLVAQCLQRVMALNPHNEEAKKALQSVLAKMQQASQGLNAKQNPRPATPAAQGPQPSEATTDRMGDSTWPPVQSQTTDEPRPGYTPDPERVSGWLTRQVATGLEFDEMKRRGIVAAKGGRYEEAMEYLMLAVEKNESDPESWYWLSTVIEDPEDKQIAIDNVLTLEPDHPAARAAAEANAPLLERKLAEKQARPEMAAVSTTPVAQSAVSPPLATHASAPPTNVTGGGSRLHNQVMGARGTGSIPSPGQVVAGKYTVLRQMRGGTDIAAWDATRRSFYILRPHVGDAAELGGTAAQGTVTHGSTRYTVLPIETKGLSLSSFIRTVGALPPVLVAQYGMSMLKTLEAEQARNPNASAQKSLRPDTITLDADSNISLEPPSVEHATMSLSSHAAPYIPPEQLEKGLLTPTSDIYSMGAILFYMLTGTPPSLYRIPQRQGEKFVSPDFSAFGGAPDDLARVIATALQTNPLERYPSASAMRDALKATDAWRGGGNFYIPMKALVTAAVIGALALGLVFVGGKLKEIKLDFLNNGGNQQTQIATPVAAPVVAPTSPPAPPPVSKLVLNGVDSRRFPQNIAYFSALDKAGMPVPYLATNMVALKENGQDVGPVRLTQLNNTTDSISVIMVLDTSEKMAGRPMDDAKTAIHIFADGMQPGDRMALISYGGSAQLIVPYTVSKSAFLAGVDSMVAAEKPVMEDAFALIADVVEEQPQGGYTAVIMISNGGLSARQPDMALLIGQANEANVPVFFVGLDPATYPGNAAAQLASATGGLAYKPAKPEAGPVAEAMKMIEKQIHNVYKLTFDSHGLGFGAPHNLELTLTAGQTVLTDKRPYQVWPKP